MCWGYFTSVAWLRPVEEFSTSTITSGRMPDRCATQSTSAAAARLVADSRLFSAFAACPAPDGPTCTMFAPIGSRCAMADCTAAGSPPTMIDSSPVVALATPPETGASTYSEPLSARRARTAVACSPAPRTPCR